MGNWNPSIRYRDLVQPVLPWDLISPRVLPGVQE